MSQDLVDAACRAVMTAMAELRALAESGDGQSRIDGLKFHRMLQRQSQHDSLALIAGLEREGEFAELGVRAAPAVADIVRCTPYEARRLVALANSVFPTSLAGALVEPKLPATATGLAGWEIDQGHAAVIEKWLCSPAGARIEPERWAGAEAQLADWARIYRPDELDKLARSLVERLDQDGPPPDEDEPQVNELSLTQSPDGVGGRIKGRLDSSTFEVLVRAIRAGTKPEADEHKTLAQRQADALGEICEHALDEARLPEQGGERPHVSMILDYDRLREQARQACLEFGGRIGPAELRRLLCDAKITPMVFDGAGQPLDVGREKRCCTPAQRKAVAARDGGCAHPGCDRTPIWCEIHHVTHWLDGGESAVRNYVMLCRSHHKMIHQSGWVVRMRDGFPEFIPPKWLDITQTPRRKPRPNDFKLIG